MMNRIFVKINKFYAHFMGETGPSKLHEMEKKRLTLLLEYYNQKYNRTKYAKYRLVNTYYNTT